MPVPPKYKYYAFISYSRKNTKAAAFLHKGFEKFKVPVQKIEQDLLPPDKKYMRPIFRDKRDLEVSAADFSEHIKKALENSRYLVVICSPESAASIWVEDEIQYFLKTHNNNISSVVPIILSGNPGCNNREECLPRPLRITSITSRNLPRMVPDEGDSEKDGWENGLIQAMSYMLQVKRESIKATVDAERIRFLKRCAIIAFFALLIFILLTIWAMNAENKAKANEKLALKNAEEAHKQSVEAKRQAEIAKKNEAKAKEQKEISQESLKFLENIFSSADPTQSGNKDIKVLDAIKAKLPEIHGIEKTQLKASVAMTVGSILMNLGEFNQSEEFLTTAAALYEENKEELKKLADTYNNLGNLYRILEKNSEALTYHMKALQIREKHFPTNYEDLAASYNNIGLVHAAQKKFDVLTYYLKALKILKTHLPEHHQSIAYTYNNMAIYYETLGNYSLSQDNFHAALEIREQYLPKSHPLVASGYHNVGASYFLSKDYSNALEYCLKALEIREASLPENHPDTAVSYSMIGSIYNVKKQYQEALKYYRKALNIKEMIFQKDHSAIAHSYADIGHVLKNMQQYSEALEYLKKSLAIKEKIFPKKHPDFANSYNDLGVLNYDQKNYPEALEYFKKTLSILEENYLERHPLFAQIYHNKGNTYHALKNYSKALENYWKALKLLEKIFPPDHHDIVKNYDKLGDTYYARKNYSEAMKCYEKADERKNSSSLEYHLENAKRFNNMGKIYLATKEKLSALSCFNKALKFARRHLGKNHTFTQEINQNIRETRRLRR